MEEIGHKEEEQSGMTVIIACSPPVVVKRIVKEVVHPNYNAQAKNKRDDIALLRLASEVELTDFVATICLHLDASQWNQDYTGDDFSAAGWGERVKFKFLVFSFKDKFRSDRG